MPLEAVRGDITSYEAAPLLDLQHINHTSTGFPVLNLESTIQEETIRSTIPVDLDTPNTDHPASTQNPFQALQKVQEMGNSVISEGNAQLDCYIRSRIPSQKIDSYISQPQSTIVPRIEEMKSVQVDLVTKKAGKRKQDDRAGGETVTIKRQRGKNGESCFRCKLNGRAKVSNHCLLQLSSSLANSISVTKSEIQMSVTGVFG